MMVSLGNVDSPLLSSDISTVLPATSRGEENGAHELQCMDLLTKLHYFRAVCFFNNSEAVQGLTIHDLKKPMFPLLDPYHHVAGRIRRSENGRPFIKCNDAGVRIAEAHCDKALDEWFSENGYSMDAVVHDHVLGPDLGFSPLVFVKFTWFKCGGLSVGLSWAHVLGDAFSALNFITMWSQTLAGQVPPKSLQVPNQINPDQFPSSVSQTNPISVRSANIIGEYWLATNDSKVETHSFHVTSTQLEHLASMTFVPNKHAAKTTSYFEILSALLWKSISHIKGDSRPSAVTICTHTSNRRENDFPINGLVLSKVEADSEAGNSDISELARLIAEKKMVENHVVEKLVEKDEGIGDFIVYGANLTFVDFEELNFYGVKLNGQKPILANCNFHGVGDQGVVLVLPAPEDNGGSSGRMITVTLPEKELDQLKYELGREWGIV